MKSWMVIVYKINSNLLICLFFSSAFLINSSCYAGVVITGTRIIYPGDKSEVTVTLKNTSKKSALVQSWIDTGDPRADPTNNPVPFIIMPPITRINGEKGQSLRLMNYGGRLPDDRESLFWLNVLSISPKEKSNINSISVAYQTRMKLFYRPSKLIGGVIGAARKLSWKRTKNKLIITNPTAFYISILKVNWSGVEMEDVIHADIIAPFSKKTFSLNQRTDLQRENDFRYEIIDDMGAVQVIKGTLSQSL